MFSSNFNHIDVFKILNKTKQTKFFDFTSKNKASLGVLTGWINSKKKSLDFSFSLVLSNYFFLSLYAGKLFQILQFKLLLLMLIKLYTFSKRSNTFSSFNLSLSLLKPLHFFYNFNFILFTNSNILS